MKAVRISKHGGLDALTYDDIPEPDCPSDKVKIRVKAAAINHLDIWVRKGLPGKPVSLPLILGSDASGTIVEVGSQVHNFQVGNDVVIQPGTFCGNCHHCKEKKENYWMKPPDPADEAPRRPHEAQRVKAPKRMELESTLMNSQIQV